MATMRTDAGWQPRPAVSGAGRAGGNHGVSTKPMEGDAVTKCATCGMTLDGNPAHDPAYEGVGAHAFKKVATKGGPGSGPHKQLAQDARAESTAHEQMAEKHRAMGDRLTNQDDHDKAHQHYEAASAHDHASETYDRASRSFNKGDELRGEDHMDKAERRSDAAYEHSRRLGMKSHPLKVQSDILIAPGGTIKSLGDNPATGNLRFEGWLVQYDTADLVNDVFQKSTQFFVEDGAIIPVLYDHGLNPTIKRRKIGRGKVVYKDAGLWLEGELERRDDYEKAIAELVVNQKSGLSSGAAQHMVSRKTLDAAKGLQGIEEWGIAEASVTITPTESLNTLSAVKSLAEYALLRQDPFVKTIKKEERDGETRYVLYTADGSKELGEHDTMAEAAAQERAIEAAKNKKAVIEGDDPHKFTPSEADPDECAVCGEELEEGYHSNIPVKGGPGSGKSSDEHPYKVVQKSEDGDATVSTHEDAPAAKSAAQKGMEESGDEHHVVHRETGDVVSRVKPQGARKSVDVSRPMKSLFTEKLAQRSESVWQVRAALDEVFGDIATAASVEDVTGTPVDVQQKVVEAVTEYAGRLVLMATQQINEWKDQIENPDKGITSSCGGPSRFYLRSLDTDYKGTLDTFMQLKGGLAHSLTLDRHSQEMVNVCGELATVTDALALAMKAYNERVADKIKFRAADPAHKAGRVLSAATSDKLSTVHGHMGKAITAMTEAHAHLGELMTKAKPKDGADNGTVDSDATTGELLMARMKSCTLLAQIELDGAELELETAVN